MRPPPCVLTIAGSDSGAGAGVQADARTIHALGGYALTAITAITAQNKRGVQRWSSVPSRLLAAQVSAVLDDFPVRAIKTGLLPGSAAIRTVAAALRHHPDIPLVIDPVMGSTTGTRFLSAAGIRTFERELLVRATLITPNWPEAAVLAGHAVKTPADAERAGRGIAARAGVAVLVKGGHGTGLFCRDCLITREGEAQWFTSRRVKSQNTHGTGCVLSAAIASGLAQGFALPAAVEKARAFLQRALVASRRVRWGRGFGPAFP